MCALKLLANQTGRDSLVDVLVEAVQEQSRSKITCKLRRKIRDLEKNKAIKRLKPKFYKEIYQNAAIGEVAWCAAARVAPMDTR